MEKFYIDKERNEVASSYVGKTMGEIMELEEKRFEKNKPEIDAKHAEFAASRSRMLTVKKLIAWLQTQDQDACVLAYEQNSDAYIEQLPDLPNCDIQNVAQAKKQMREDLKSWYRDTPDAEQKIEKDIAVVFRYAEDNDVVIKFN